jgi:hypothetical protein
MVRARSAVLVRQMRLSELRRKFVRVGFPAVDVVGGRGS